MARPRLDLQTIYFRDNKCIALIGKSRFVFKQVAQKTRIIIDSTKVNSVTDIQALR